jgi:hypothetical protein
MKRNIRRSKNSGRQGVKIPCQDWYALLDSQANWPNRLRALLKQVPDEEKDKARDRAHAAGNLAAARELGGNFQKIATNIQTDTSFS